MPATMLSAQKIVDWLHSIAAVNVSQTANLTANLTADSRRVQAGDVFFAYPGDSADGRRYIADAIERGAAAIVYEEAGFNWDDKEDLPHFGVKGLKHLAGFAANMFYKQPDKDMFSVAVTGTNGKTSCSYWLGMALSRLQGSLAPVAVIGTLGVGMFQDGKPHAFDVTGYTTPDAVLLQRKLSDLRTARASVLAIEASSIGLDQGRMNGLHVDVALFTNFTRDHLDYHGDMIAYEAAKIQLFDSPGLQHAVINLDDQMGQRLIPYLQAKNIPVIGYSLGDITADDVPVLRASAIRSTNAGTSFHIESPFGSGQVKTQLVGQFNVSNVLGILGVMLAKGTGWEAALAVIATLTAVPGRMQQFGGQEVPLIVIDYAHTPDALEKTLSALRQVANQRGGELWCVFGCGGDRDPGKRPEMGSVSELADHVILTSDNPRSEDPNVIISHIKSGMARIVPHVMTDRAGAILWAVRHAVKQDVVLLAGKGHETYQEIAGKKYPFLDADHVALALAARATMMGGA
ncbi:UDP-N-acetylmuramoyl-L-alanyl-D-glutamate--2,6-diaminopimelate ligase [Herbaspirillum sp. meg3]|uniref:UDP-N-acetylmuramoyl-L-alanyl-D-glutamate--2, 6-diaminopimelate ligase n=1 Tax=Herbaspirillum sp. meg3 TaxID=2025949 RepID=UPI0018DF44E4|nr:UDP-N-acetylmuramoyl-L-alanyl-D-glutamate--2,6-diaminopimelate ligase [Herbaspirillum sp. meg3]